MIARVLLVFALTLTACHRTPPDSVNDQSSAFPARPPVVNTAPIDSASYDRGFKAGYPIGNAAATPKAAVPSEQEVRKLCGELFESDDQHNPTWHRGWVAGYLDGYRAKAQGAK